jgi:hypothetical protein
MSSLGERGIWQPRYWEHTIRDDQDFGAQMEGSGKQTRNNIQYVHSEF